MNIHINDKLIYYLPILCELEKMDREKVRSTLKEFLKEEPDKQLPVWRDKLSVEFDPLKAVMIALSLALRADNDYSKILRVIQQKKGVLYASEIIHCLFLCETNQFDEALKIIRGLPLTISKLPVIAKLKADVLFDLEDYPESLRAYKEALGRVPNNSLVHSRIGEIYLLHKEQAAAKEHFQKAIEDDAKNMMAHLYLGDLYKEEGKVADAKREYGICAAIDFQSQVSKLAQQKLLILCREDRPPADPNPG